MKPTTKKRLIVISSLLVIGSVIGYVIYKRKKDKESLTDIPSDTLPVLDTLKEGAKEVKNEASKIIKNVTKPKTTTSTEKMISASDLLAANLNNAINREVYSKLNNIPVFNQKGQVSYRAKAGEYLGKGSKGEKTPNGIWLYFKNPNGVFYKALVSSLNIK